MRARRRPGAAALGSDSARRPCPGQPSGGLLSKGHPVGATGCAQLVELADQLRGRCGAATGRRRAVALAENGGGYLGNDAAVATVTILGT